jgi:hypothetical protein
VDDGDGVRVDEFCSVMVTNFDVLIGHVRGHGVVREFDSAFIAVFIHGSGSILAMVNIQEQLAKVNGALSCTTEGGIFNLGESVVDQATTYCCLEVKMRHRR